MRLASTLLSGSLILYGASGSVINSLECAAVTIVIKSLSAIPSATPFCSSFLGIKTSTTTTTTTTTLPTVTTTTTTTVGTTTITPAPVTTTVTTTSTSSYCSPSAMQPSRKRQAGLPSPIASFQSAQISTACSCLNIPTPTSTVTQTATSSPTSTITSSVTATVTLASSTVTSTATTTTTVTACPTPPMCGNSGLQYGAFRNPFPNSTTPYYPQYDPTYLKAGNNGQQYLLYNDTVNPPGGLNGQCNSNTNIYGSSNTVPCSFFTVDHRGYFFVPTSGNYTFAARNVDDIAFFWGGPTALSGWNRGNANLIASGKTTPPNAFMGEASSAAYTVQLVQGQYYPIRIVFANAQSHYGFDFTVVDPFNDPIICSVMSMQPSVYLVEYSCDGTTAPRFPGNFGSEP